MLVELLKIGGVTALVVGVMFLLYREVLRLEIFPMLSKKQTFQLLMLLIILVWSLAMYALISTGGIQISQLRTGDVTNGTVIVNQGS